MTLSATLPVTSMNIFRDEDEANWDSDFGEDLDEKMKLDSSRQSASNTPMFSDKIVQSRKLGGGTTMKFIPYSAIIDEVSPVTESHTTVESNDSSTLSSLLHSIPMPKSTANSLQSLPFVNKASPKHLLERFAEKEDISLEDFADISEHDRSIGTLKSFSFQVRDGDGNVPSLSYSQLITDNCSALKYIHEIISSLKQDVKCCHISSSSSSLSSNPTSMLISKLNDLQRVVKSLEEKISCEKTSKEDFPAALRNEIMEFKSLLKIQQTETDSSPKMSSQHQLNGIYFVALSLCVLLQCLVLALLFCPLYMLPIFERLSFLFTRTPRSIQPF